MLHRLASLLLLGASLLSAGGRTPATPSPDTASLIGNVRDENHVPLPGATVRLRHALTQSNVVVRANALGEYEFVNLRPGRYSLRAEAKNHEQIWLCEVVIARGTRVRQDIVLRSLRPGRELTAPVCPERDARLMEPSSPR